MDQPSIEWIQPKGNEWIQPKGNEWIQPKGNEWIQPKGNEWECDPLYIPECLHMLLALLIPV